VDWSCTKATVFGRLQPQREENEFGQRSLRNVFGANLDLGLAPFAWYATIKDQNPSGLSRFVLLVAG
jgi:hypothetical protein